MKEERMEVLLIRLDHLRKQVQEGDWVDAMYSLSLLFLMVAEELEIEDVVDANDRA